MVIKKTHSPVIRHKVSAIPLTLTMLFPWIVSLFMQEPASGSIASFGAYMLVISFSVLPVKNPLQQVLIAAGIMIFFATLGFSAPGGSIYFFLFAILAALAQGLAELRGGNLRLPVSLAALVFFLAHGQSSAETLSQYIFSFGLGCLWAIPFILIFIPKETLSPARAPLYPMESPTQRRFLLGITFTALLGTIAVSLSTVAHACWIPAAALRVVKPGWEETRYRIQTRSMGTMLGAIVGSIILVCYPYPLFHIAIVGGMFLLMLQFGAKNYFRWSFCLTTITLAFNPAVGSDIFSLAQERVLFTIEGISIAFIMMKIFSYKRS
ncbi:TPA: FUSC family protein [Klebsiella pneumoniae]|nr:FUSC family protein [Klebsiella pneumoniae]VEC49706.1 integral membrane protein, YccS/YhfK family [Klebsiella aerogenes]ELA0657213.1 FUSC family protein [Klebsiella pneumoniae]MBK5821242.1 FUSC family protein [Klebsiella pneumoniae]OUY52132.1 FUSC family protein [Klebsiella pneumoniae]